MAYDEDLADRIRELMSGEGGVVEKKMFGGLAFLVGGNMSVGPSGQGGLLVRVDPDEWDALTARDGVEPMVMGGKEMRGWVRVESRVVESDPDLAEWVARGVAFARALPAK